MTDNEKPTELKAASLEPNEQTVQILRDWLNLAERGRLRGVLLIGMVTGGMTRRGYAGDYGFPELIYACEVAKHDLMHQSQERDEYVEGDDD